MSSEQKFSNGDAVIATDGDFSIMGVVVSEYDDVVEVDYFDEFGEMDTMEFHVSCIESVI